MKGRQAAFEEAIQEAPVIAAVKNDMGLAHALRSECAAVFILYGTILDIGQIVKRIKAAGKLAFVHADLIEGLSNRGGDRRGFSGGGYKSGWDHLHQTQSHPSREGTGTDHGAAFFPAGFHFL